MLRFKIIFSLICLGLASLVIQAHGKPPGELVRQLNDAYVDVFDKVSPSVVVIEVEKSAKTPFPLIQGLLGGTPAPSDETLELPPEKSEGSGIICRADGYIYTNTHVVSDGGKITVTLKDGRSFPAKVVGTDSYSDVAILKIDAKDLPVVTFANSDEVRVGHLACVIGAPFNLTYSFTTGVISAKGRNKIIDSSERWGGQFEDFLQTDASINPGNSGGPLLDIEGRVIGMNTIIQDVNRGLGFAISSNLMQRVGEELILNGKIARPYLGVAIRSLKDATATADYADLKSGVIIQSFRNDSPAFRSGLRPGDVILKVDNISVAEASELQREVQKKKVGQTLQLAVWRRGKELTLPIVAGEMPADLNSPKSLEESILEEQENNPSGSLQPQPDEGTSKQKQEEDHMLGLEVQTLTEELALARKSKAQKGVIVTSVKEGTEASAAGVKVGDIITELNGTPVLDEESFVAALGKADPQKGALLFVEREKGSAYLVLKHSQ